MKCDLCNCRIKDHEDRIQRIEKEKPINIFLHERCARKNGLLDGLIKMPSSKEEVEGKFCSLNIFT